MQLNRNDATTQRERHEMHENEIAEGVAGAAFRGHRWFGPGLLESAYEACLARELVEMDFPVGQQVPLPLVYRNVRLGVGYRLDIRVDRKPIAEVKAVEEFHPVYMAQMLTYLKLTDLLKDGIPRVANKLVESNEVPLNVAHSLRRRVVAVKT